MWCLICVCRSRADDWLRSAELPSSEPAAIREQLKAARALSDDISGQKARVRDVLSAAKKLIRDAAQYDDVSEVREKADQLRDTADTVSAAAAGLGIVYLQGLIDPCKKLS